jgi:hypothetical protein
VNARVAIAAAVALALVAGFIGRGDGPTGTPPDDDVADAAEGGDPIEALRAAIPAPEIDLPQPPPPARKVRAPHFAIARVESGHRVEVHDAPGGKVLRVVGERTEFGSVRTFWIAKVRGDWFGVPMAGLPNGKLAWIENDESLLDLLETRYSIVADVSNRMLELRYGRQVLDRFPVTVGSPTSPTPVGKYSITDGLVGTNFGPYYGCCVLALTGHQDHLPPDWIGGDRIAIHGTPQPVGGAGSAGCLRATDPDMVSLFARVPLGAPVFIRA